MLQLRPYQQDAIAAVYQYLRQHDGNPVVVCPTGSGKSILIAQIVTDAATLWSGRVLVVTHVRELIEQNAEKIRALCPGIPVGIYSAGLNRRDTERPVICAGIQSIYKRAGELGRFDLILVDEAHLIPPDGEGMYRTFLADIRATNPDVRVLGFTATPFRTDAGPICTEDGLFSAICFEIGVRPLIAGGYLCPLVSKAGLVKADTSRLSVRGGEFQAGDVEALMDRGELVEAACAEIVQLTKDRNACLIFASGIQHGRHVQRVLENKHGVECGFVCGETPPGERDQLLARFRGEPSGGLFEHKPLKYLCNVGVLTTGFDAPNIDCVVLLRPTASPGLFVQMVGRGLRLHPGKRDCLILDYGGNVLRHGPVDQVQVKPPGQGTGEPPAKECPACRALIATGYATCPQCGHVFPPRNKQRHEAEAAHGGVLSGQVSETEYDVRDIRYSVHVKKDAPDDAPRTMRVEYRLGLSYCVSEWICFEHTGWARRKAEAWWKERSPDPVPDTAERAVEIAEAGGVAVTESVTVRSVVGEPFDRIIGYKLGPMPEPVLNWNTSLDDEDVPF